MSTLRVNNITDLGDDAVVTDGVIPTYPGQILQLVSTTKTDTFSTTSTSFTDVTGLSATITPSSTSSKIYVSISFVYGTDNASAAFDFKLARDGVAIAQADTGGTRDGTMMPFTVSATARDSGSITFLDSPSTTSSVVYNLKAASQIGNTVYVNRGATDVRSVSTITLMEVAG